MMPYRKAAELLAEFLPIEPTEGHVTVRKRTLTVGARLEEQSLGRSRTIRQLRVSVSNSNSACRMIRCGSSLSASIRPMCDAPIQRRREFRNSRGAVWTGGRGSPPGHYFATADTSQREMRARTLQALQAEGYSGYGEITVLSDGAEIMKRLPKALPKPATHIIDWFHLAMKI